MARYTKAYSSFISGLSEVKCLCQLALEKEQLEPIKLSSEINALGRGAVVLLSSHLEAYIKEIGQDGLNALFIRKVDRANISSTIFYHISKDIINEIKDTSDPAKISEKIFTFLDSDLDFWSKQGPFLNEIDGDRFNLGFSNPAFKKINSYFNRFGYSDYKGDLARSLTSRYQPTINMVDHLVDTRNKIAHGDPMAKKTPSEMKNMIETIHLFCRETDSIVANWWASNYCPIR